MPTLRFSLCRPGAGRQPDVKLDTLSNILKEFNDQWAGLFDDPKRMEERITDEIPTKVSADQAYQNAKAHSDRQNARIEHDKALQRVVIALFKDDAQLFKQFQDNESFRRWLTDTILVSLSMSRLSHPKARIIDLFQAAGLKQPESEHSFKNLTSNSCSLTLGAMTGHGLPAGPTASLRPPPPIGEAFFFPVRGTKNRDPIHPKWLH